MAYPLTKQNVGNNHALLVLFIVLSRVILVALGVLIILIIVCFQVCALHVTDGAQARILKAGGEIITFDQLALRAPQGQHTVLLQGI